MPNKISSRPRTFKIVRFEDVSGVSGVGVVAEGCVFHDGQAVLSWFGRHHTIEIAPDIQDVITIHGHGGKTKLVWDTEVERKKFNPRECQVLSESKS